MIVLALDPGFTKQNPLGIALLGSPTVLLDHRIHVPDDKVLWEARLPAIISFLDCYMTDRGTVEAVAYEIPFCGKNPLVAIMLAHVGGIARALAWHHGVPCVMVRPSQAKLALTGHGGATKEMMMREAGRRFGITLTKDEADAVGVALAAWDVLK